MRRWIYNAGVYRYSRKPLFNVRHETTSSSAGQRSITNYLSVRGLTANDIEELITSLKQNNMEPSLSLLHGLGDKGIQEYMEAIRRQRKDNRKKIKVNVKAPDGHSFSLYAFEGDSLQDCVETSKELGEYIECVCGGIAACSTCHVYVSPDYLPKLPPIEESEQDMLDLVDDLRFNSRLGCQIHLDASCDGISFEIPSSVHDYFG